MFSSLVAKLEPIVNSLKESDKKDSAESGSKEAVSENKNTGDDDFDDDAGRTFLVLKFFLRLTLHFPLFVGNVIQQCFAIHNLILF